MPARCAGFYVWLPVPKGYSSVDFAKVLLERAGVLVIPGVGYGQHGEGYIRLSYANSVENIRDALEAMEASLPDLANR